jgi:hypothetical protein
VLGAVLLVVSTATVLAATANTPPQFANLTASASVVDVGQPVTVTGSFTDPDVADPHTIVVQWDEQRGIPGRVEKKQLEPGQTSFDLSHTYSAPLAPTHISVTVEDHPPASTPHDNNHGGNTRDNRRLPIEVRAPAPAPPANVAPRFVTSSIFASKARQRFGIVTVRGDWVDPDPDDGEVTFVSSGGRPPRDVPACTTAGRHFECIYQYRVPAGGKTYDFELHLADGHGGTDTYKSTVQMR